MPHDPNGFVLEMLEGPSVDDTLTTEEDILELVLFNQAQAVEMGRDEWLELDDGRGPKGDPGAILLEAEETDAVAALIAMDAPGNVLVFRKVEL